MEETQESGGAATAETQPTLPLEGLDEARGPQEDQARDGKEDSGRKRQSLRLGERMKVLDHLRGLPSPIRATSGAEAAAAVSRATGVELSWQSLNYMLDQCRPEYDLSAKIVIHEPDSPEVRLKRLEEQQEARYRELLHYYSGEGRVLDTLNSQTGRLDDLGRRVQALEDMSGDRPAGGGSVGNYLALSNRVRDLEEFCQQMKSLTIGPGYGTLGENLAERLSEQLGEDPSGGMVDVASGQLTSGAAGDE